MGGMPMGGKGGMSGGGAGAGGKGGSGGGGMGGTPMGGAGMGGGGSGGKGGAGGAGGSGPTGCAGVDAWTAKAYALGDMVSDTCSGVFAAPCATGQKHKFECNPPAGAGALAWCEQREPGVGNGWTEAWVDKGVCQ
jgi:hypothetical protein